MALAFLASVTATVVWCKSMGAMPGMKMPGGWTMSMAWSRAPGQTWLEVGGEFLAMWTGMMVAMMLPVFTPELKSFQRGAHRREMQAVGFASGYFGVWAAVGLALFPMGVGFNSLAMHSEMLSRVTPLLGGLVVMIAGALQFTSWKARALVGCRLEEECGGSRWVKSRDGMRAGARLGLRCVQCCAGLTASLLAIGVMDLFAMALITFAIGAERFRRSATVARMVGAGMLIAGIVLVGRATLI
jgi:predicted metal-binding membrane protein